MDMVKKFFPFAFKVQKKDMQGMIVMIVLHIVASLALGIVLWVVGLLSGIPVLGILVGIVCWAVGTVGGLYILASLILTILHALDVLKD